MDKKVKIGIVYTAKNTITGEVYVGVTTKGSIEIRIQDHINKAKNENGAKFQQAIATYGPDAFNWEQVDTANSIDELAEKEKQYIIKFNAKENGYNLDAGGGIQKPVFKYDLNGNLVAKYGCLDEAAKTVNSTKQSISDACLSVNKKYKGFYWSYHYQEPFVSGTDKRLKTVSQFTLDGAFVQKFKSVAKASRVTGFSKTSIAKVCRGEYSKSNGFIWRYCS